jgi:hypothetical protein
MYQQWNKDHPFRQKDGGQVIPSSYEEERTKKYAKLYYNSYADTLYEGWWSNCEKEYSILIFS